MSRTLVAIISIMHTVRFVVFIVLPTQNWKKRFYLNRANTKQYNAFVIVQKRINHILPLDSVSFIKKTSSTTENHSKYTLSNREWN